MIKIFKDGYQPFELFIDQSKLKEFHKAVALLEVSSEGQLTNSFSAKEPDYFLCALTPSSGSGSQQASYQGSTVIRVVEGGGDRTEAQREYEAALAAYEEAKREFYRTGTTARLTEEGYNQMNPGLGLLAGLAGGAATNEAKISLESARDRLERAKARLDALN